MEPKHQIMNISSPGQSGREDPNDRPALKPADPISPCSRWDESKGTQQHEPEEQESSSPPESVYSSFTVTQKRWIVFLVAATGMFSPLSSFIYYPAISSIASGLNTSVELINLTVTSYMAVSGVVPTIMGNAADGLGRRPIYMLTMLIYLVANVGLALQDSFPALLVLRMLQSAGSSGTIALGYGVISDITTPAERGSFVGLVLLGPNVAPPLGPVLGGVLSSKLGWRWIFWFLAILSASLVLVLIVFLPETARAIVGNGQLRARGLHRSICGILRPLEDKDANQQSRGRSKIKIPNPLDCALVLARKDSFIVILCNGLMYVTYCCVQASLSTLFIRLYGFHDLQAGLIYIPFGIGCLGSTYLSGKLLDYDYANVAKSCESEGNRVIGNDVRNFPIEKARLRSVFYIIAGASLSIVAYGWFLCFRIHFAVPLVMQFIIGATSTAVFTIMGTLLTDINASASSTAAASANIVRCALAAVGLAVIETLIQKVGPGWCFTIFSGITAAMGPLLLLLREKGIEWRAKRCNKQQGGC